MACQSAAQFSDQLQRYPSKARVDLKQAGVCKGSIKKEICTAE
jgi:hypothetical protein